ncbi:MAG: hypothetical protein GY906_36640, partial [bacterium]|nr:hypothetical protein [bacterium]
MRKCVLALCCVIAVALCVTACCPSQETDSAKAEFPVLQGPYLGQQPPGEEPQLFAPGIIGGGMATRDVTISPDGEEIFYGAYVGQYDFSTILRTRKIDEVWSEPEVADFATNPNFTYLEAQISPDGQRLFFFSDQPGPNASEGGNQDIWAIDRADTGWGEPYNLGPPISTEAAEFFPSVTHDGTLYFTRNPVGEQASYIYRSRLVDGAYTEP